MTALTSDRERHAVVQYASRCAFCRALLAHSQRRGDRLLLDAAEQLAEEHAENDAERMTLLGQPRSSCASATAWARHERRSGSELLLTAVTSKTRVRNGRRDA
jgi:hypothetical protein